MTQWLLLAWALLLRFWLNFPQGKHPATSIRWDSRTWCNPKSKKERNRQIKKEPTPPSFEREAGARAGYTHIPPGNDEDTRWSSIDTYQDVCPAQIPNWKSTSSPRRQFKMSRQDIEAQCMYDLSCSESNEKGEWAVVGSQDGKISG